MTTTTTTRYGIWVEPCYSAGTINTPRPHWLEWWDEKRGVLLSPLSFRSEEDAQTFLDAYEDSLSRRIYYRDNGEMGLPVRSVRPIPARRKE